MGMCRELGKMRVFLGCRKNKLLEIEIVRINHEVDFVVISRGPPPLNYMCDMTHSYVCHDSHMCEFMDLSKAKFAGPPTLD